MVWIRRKLDSETLHIPELRPLIGQTVEIIITPLPEIIAGTGDWDAAQGAAQRLGESSYDFDAWRQQREYDQKQANEHLP